MIALINGVPAHPGKEEENHIKPTLLRARLHATAHNRCALIFASARLFGLQGQCT